MHFRPISERKVSSVVNVLAEKSALVKNFLLSLPGLLRREWRSVLAVLSANIIFAFAVIVVLDNIAEYNILKR